MAATNFTPIQLYHSTTASAVPLAANLAQGELAINITDGKLYYEDNTGVVQVIATKGAGTIGGSTTQIQYNNAGALAGNAAMVFNSATSVTTLTTLNLTNALGVAYGGTGLTAGTSGGVLAYTASGTLASSAALAASALVIGGGAGAAPSTTTTGTGVVTALGVNVGTAGAFVVNGGALGTPSSGTVTNLTGTASININGTVGATTPTTGAFTSLTASTTLGVTGVSTLTGGAVIQGLTVGLGAGAVSTNTATGVSALAAANTGAGYNVGVGYQALIVNTSGEYNTAVGGLALWKNTSGVSNTASGLGALYSNLSGSNNTAYGRESLNQNTTASNNTAVGFQAGYTNIIGTQNVYVGYQAGYASTGSYNTALGYAALKTNLTGEQNTAIAREALFSCTTGSNNTAVGNTSLYSVTSGTSNTAVGRLAGSDITTGSSNVILGAYSGVAAPISATGSNFVVLSDGDGNIVASTKTANTFALPGGTLSSGTGIAFPATQSASTNANTLDDYEESTWTPVLAFGGNSVGITYTSGYNTSSVTKIGSRVFVSGITLLSSKGSSTGNASLKSLPFPPSGAAGFSAGACSLANTTFTGQYAIEVDANDAVVYFYQVSALGAQSNLTNTNFANNSAFTFSFSYYTSA